jgi:hypothetical protein
MNLNSACKFWVPRQAETRCRDAIISLIALCNTRSTSRRGNYEVQKTSKVKLNGPLSLISSLLYIISNLTDHNMGRNYARTRKNKTESQVHNLNLARAAHKLKLATDNTESHSHRRKCSKEHIHQMQVKIYQIKARNTQKRYWKLLRRAKRVEENNSKQKEHLKALKNENTWLQREVDQSSKANKKLNDDMTYILHGLQSRITKLLDECKQLRREQAKFKRKALRINTLKSSMREQARRSSLRGPVFKLMHKGVYTRQARQLARYLSSVGTAEAKVGEAIVSVGKMIGVEVDRVMDKRTVKRAMLESGVAAEIQLGYEMVKSERKSSI